MELKSANTEYSVQLEQLTQQLDVLTSRKQQLEDEMAVSAVKREAAQLYEQVLYCTVLYCTICTILCCTSSSPRPSPSGTSWRRRHGRGAHQLRSVPHPIHQM